ncbi:MAG: sigma-54 dependent transcriptional regulator [Candidatus Kapabacteria bacterium]|jgi:DNA-binding NtrC family response regulator|nr:sigma-54 dependent transcriptional regulator [Candidatus Kapabacteria bacterium]
MKNTKFGAILAVDDNADVLTSLRLLLKQHFATIHTEANPQAIPALLKNTRYDVILLDMNFTKDVSSGAEGFEWLEKIHALDPNVAVIMLTAYGDVSTAIRAIKEGATDFVLKPWQNEKLVATINAAMELSGTRREVETLKTNERALKSALSTATSTAANQDFIIASPAMQQISALIEKVAATDANVLILGENGTGKEVIAREVHRRSLRAKEAYIGVDMGALPETLFESELFGTMKGAFTDAKEDRAGRFEIASGGTLFLDEIGNISLPAQSKLLAALQNRTITRLGSSKTIPINIRLICATNMPLYEMVEQKQFRQDLLYRINTVEIHIPPLRDRKEDIPILAEYFLQSYSAKYRKPAMRLSSAALKKLEQYPWRGNIRELQHTLERVVIMADSAMIDAGDIALSGTNPQSQGASGNGLVVENLNLDEVEKAVIRKSLHKHNGNVSHAADELGLTRAALYRRMEKYGL